MKTILLPTDFSINAEKARDYALKMFGSEAQFIIVNVFDTPKGPSESLISIADILKEESIQNLKSELAFFEKNYPNIQVKTYSERGALADVLQRAVKQFGADYIFLGTKGASGLKEMLLGSNSATVIQSVTNCPLFIIPENADSSLPQNIVVATDSHEIEPAYKTKIAGLAQLLGARVQGLHIVTPKKALEPMYADPDAANADFGTRVHYAEGNDVEKELLKYMEIHAVDLLVVIKQKYPFFERIFHKSVTKGVVMHASSPMLIFHQH